MEVRQLRINQGTIIWKKSKEDLEELEKEGYKTTYTYIFRLMKTSLTTTGTMSNYIELVLSVIVLIIPAFQYLQWWQCNISNQIYMTRSNSRNPFVTTCYDKV